MARTARAAKCMPTRCRSIDGHESRTTSAASGDGELLSQGEVVQDQGLSRECYGPNSPEDQLEREEHRDKMRGWISDGKRRR